MAAISVSRHWLAPVIRRSAIILRDDGYKCAFNSTTHCILKTLSVKEPDRKELDILLRNPECEYFKAHPNAALSDLEPTCLHEKTYTLQN